MTIWPDLLKDDSVPRYEAIANAIGEAAATGRLRPGERLPTQRALARLLGVTIGTVSRGYALAERRGIVEAQIGRGTFIRTSGSARTAPVAPDDRPGVDLSINMPLLGSGAEALAATLSELASPDIAANLLHYMPTAGHREHRIAAAEWIGRSGLEANPDNVILTEGAQQGLAAIFDVLVSGDEKILVERYTYSGLIENARLKKVALAGVEIDSQGLIPEALDAEAARTGARVVCIVPTIHNPTAAVMSNARREAIAEIARRRDLIVIEDDVYGYLLEKRPVPIASLIPERTIYITSASKCLAPGLRVGWLVAPPEWRDRFTDLVYAQSVAQPALNHEIVRRWIENGTAARLVSELARETAARYELAMELLDGFDLSGHPASFHVLLELPEPWTSSDFTGAALERDIRVTPLGSFALDKRSGDRAVRLSLVAATDRAALRAALTTLRELLVAAPESRRAVV